MFHIEAVPLRLLASLPSSYLDYPLLPPLPAPTPPPSACQFFCSYYWFNSIAAYAKCFLCLCEITFLADSLPVSLSPLSRPVAPFISSLALSLHLACPVS